MMLRTVHFFFGMIFLATGFKKISIPPTIIVGFALSSERGAFVCVILKLMTRVPMIRTLHHFFVVKHDAGISF